ncbi:FAD/NAD(P)-binding protein [Saccharothrix variisporea]|uniref:FAD-NAD(P)-binding protein n=1 Tax=Saccharothrix variisporea TaxID=543527 RepID=A0A495XHH6_9PSEU|nr:FAD/NAD(P)-binding domain-containing protein [Saccharothrix variisporea]RKT72545.1 FAD-NAD(P)-binding protein [Saccharothrix variisporea]
MSVVVFVGAGPRTSGVLERLGANAPALFGGPLEVHLVDPFPAGSGRVWRHEQSALLRMNSMAEDVTMFTDSSVVCEGPVRPGPSLAEWDWSTVDLPEEVRAELAAMEPTSFPSRRVQSAYLKWFHAKAVESLPRGSSVHVHPTRAVRVTGSSQLRQRVWLAGRSEPLVADVVVFALGHLDTVLSPEHAALRDHAVQHDLCFVPPAYTADADLSVVPAGEDVVVRGLGLAFIDLAVLLAEGRGGTFVRVGGVLHYLPSGREPRLHVGSRRGVPYHSKTGYRLQGAAPEGPRFFVASDLLARPGEIDFRLHVWPLIAKEVAYGYYRELFTGHPSRVRLTWEEFAGRYAELEWYSAEMRALEERAVPGMADRLDFEHLDRPIDGLAFDSADGFQEFLRSYIRADVERRSDPRFSADLGAFLALLTAYGQLAVLAASGRLTGEDGWWHGFFSYFASGPPPDRLEELLALSRAGVVRFLGADTWVRAEDGVFLAGSASVPGHVVRAKGLIEARLPTHTLSVTADPLLRSLAAGGDIQDRAGLVAVDPVDSRVLDASGAPHARRFAVGPYTTNKAQAAFARPNTNNPAFRQNDAVARAVLEFLAGDAVDESVA